MSRILITGGAGFLGSSLTELLKTMNHEIHSLSSKDGDLTLFSAADLLIGIDKPDVVFHLAARVGGIGANRAHGAKFWHDNLLMGMNVLEACRIHEVSKLILVGTTCSYPRIPKTIPFIEEEIFDGYPEETNAPYGIAKRALIAGAQAYARDYGMDIRVAIPTNLYGPRDHFDLQSSHVIPAMMRKMDEAKKSGEPVKLWGNGLATRDFLYVDDCVKGLVSLMDFKRNLEGIVNLGSGVEITVADLAKRIAETVGYDGSVIWDCSMPNGQPRRVLSTKRAEELLSWRASTPFELGLAKTYAFHLGGVSKLQS